jgi:hypothetical protein
MAGRLTEEMAMHRMTRRMATGIAAMLVVSGCATVPDGRPDWVDGNAAAYPDAVWLLGRGSGESVALAQERARADLAKAFEVAVTTSGEDVQRAARQGGEGVVFEARSEQRVSTRSEVLLRGVRIAGLWTERQGATRRHHALAALERLPAAQALRAEIGALDEAIDREVGRARSAADALAQFVAAERAVALAGERDAYQRLLRVVDSTGAGHPERYARTRLSADRDTLAGRLAIVVEAADGDEDFADLVRGALAAAGFAAAGPQPFRLAAALRAENLGRQDDGWYWLRATVEVVLRDSAGQVRGQRSWAFKVAAGEPAIARARLAAQVEATLGAELRPAIAGFGR